MLTKKEIWSVTNTGYLLKSTTRKLVKSTSCMFDQITVKKCPTKLFDKKEDRFIEIVFWQWLCRNWWKTDLLKLYFGHWKKQKRTLGEKLYVVKYKIPNQTEINLVCKYPRRERPTRDLCLSWGGRSTDWANPPPQKETFV